jgi:GNAT superfamily N-acetyltransferase
MAGDPAGDGPDREGAMPNREITVRAAGPADFDACRRFDFEHADDDEIRFKIGRGELLLAEVGGEAVGYAKLDWIGSWLPFLGLIFVTKEHRKKGVGRALLTFLEERLRERGKDRLASSSEILEPEPQAWHRRMGFRDAGILLGVNDDDSGEVFFLKAL